nr:uncharacterized protein LOC109173561 [Ipomoea batatas]
MRLKRPISQKIIVLATLKNWCPLIVRCPSQFALIISEILRRNCLETRLYSLSGLSRSYAVRAMRKKFLDNSKSNSSFFGYVLEKGVRMRPGGMEGGIPWKMSFMAWRVFRNKVPTDDVLSRFGFNVVSRCFCCNDPKQCTLQRVFCTGDVAREVWTYFGQTLGVRLHMYGIRQVRYDWWGRESGRCNRLIKFIKERLPMLVIWKLWKMAWLVSLPPIGSLCSERQKVLVLESSDSEGQAGVSSKRLVEVNYWAPEFGKVLKKRA